MSHKGRKKGVHTVVIIIELLVGAGLILGALKFRSVQTTRRNADIQQQSSESKETAPSVKTEWANPPALLPEPKKPDTGNEHTDIAADSNEVQTMTIKAEPKEGVAILDEMVSNARGWHQTLFSWSGKQLPDITLVDISGKTHKLSNYRGKKVLFIMWATWCGPCVKEIPGLISLRKETAEDELAILALALDGKNTERLKKFVTSRQINYTILLPEPHSLPIPYSMVQSIPCAFFIQPDGRLKIATLGAISRQEVKAILAVPDI